MSACPSKSRIRCSGTPAFEPPARGFAPKVVEVQVPDARPATCRLPRGLDAVRDREGPHATGRISGLHYPISLGDSVRTESKRRRGSISRFLRLGASATGADRPDVHRAFRERIKNSLDRRPIFLDTFFDAQCSRSEVRSARPSSCAAAVTPQRSDQQEARGPPATIDTAQTSPGWLAE
jgi:hypothetical protein